MFSYIITHDIFKDMSYMFIDSFPAERTTKKMQGVNHTRTDVILNELIIMIGMHILLIYNMIEKLNNLG